VRRWDIPADSGTLVAGVAHSYGGGRRALRRARKRPTDERLHEWRKNVKTLWYQIRLLERAAPSVLAPLVAQFDDLAEALGDDHDLSVLVARLESDPLVFGGKKPVKHAVRLARSQQDDLRRRAFRLGSTLYTETPEAFANRVGAYWNMTVEHGPELVTGGIAELVADERKRSGESTPSRLQDPPSRSVERERKFLVTELPEPSRPGTVLRQGYLAIDGLVSLRVRDAGGKEYTLTVKAGRGALRTELEWAITNDQFETAWTQTGERRIHKTRYRLALDGTSAGELVDDGGIVELDVFHDELDGLVLAEVEFSSDAIMEAFEPPGWFGQEVTDDPSYTNAFLAVNARRGPAADSS
jgi:CYTH domain-containing protein